MDKAKENILAMTAHRTESEIEDFLQTHSDDPAYGPLLSFLLSQGWDKFEEMLKS